METIGNHIKITNGDVSTLYAHCKTIYVKEGDKISQGQQIGETGSTGNVTGPHLHFEIRRNNEYIDPDLILDF
ncbi:MAG: M23 family metallopeptidase [Clostridia bacterium]|nr:M23 family metallopeptidase [Clostridia bacterium]